MAEAYEAETLFKSHVYTYDDVFSVPVPEHRARLRHAARVVAEEVLGEDLNSAFGASPSTQTMTANMLVRMREEGLI